MTASSPQKTPDLLDQLFDVMKRKTISYVLASILIGVDLREMYRWRDRLNVPSPLARKAILKTIRRMENFPDISFRALEADRAVYQELSGKLSVKEKKRLFASINIGEYRKRLRELKAKYEDDLPELSDATRS